VAPGKFECAQLYSNPGRVAAPALSTEVIGGKLPKNWVDYVFRPVVGTTEYIEKIVAVGIDGPMFDLPAGKVFGFFGAEFRDAEIDDAPPAVSSGVHNRIGNAPLYSGLRLPLPYRFHQSGEVVLISFATLMGQG